MASSSSSAKDDDTKRREELADAQRQKILKGLKEVQKDIHEVAKKDWRDRHGPG